MLTYGLIYAKENHRWRLILLHQKAAGAFLTQFTFLKVDFAFTDSKFKQVEKTFLLGSILSYKISSFLRFEPGTAGWESAALPLRFAVPQVAESFSESDIDKATFSRAVVVAQQ